MTSAHSDGAALGRVVGGSVAMTPGIVGDGVGIFVGEHTGGPPSGDGKNIGFSELHSSGQQVGHPAFVGKGSRLQSALLTLGSTQFGGRDASEAGKKHSSYGHVSITSAHSEGV